MKNYKMKSTWILVLSPVLLLVGSSSASLLDWSLESLFYPMTYIENKLEESFTKIAAREKRAAAAAPVTEYIVDIEITVPNSSYLDALTRFVRELVLPLQVNLSDSVLDITSANLTTVCIITDDSVQCACESGYVWPNNVCSVNPACGNTSTTCDCLATYPSQGCEVDTTPVLERHMMLTIEKEFYTQLKYPSSPEYKNLKKQLDTSFLYFYKSLKGFKSAYVTAFREGSIIAEYTLISGPVNNSELATANELIRINLSPDWILAPKPFQTVFDDANVAPARILVSLNEPFELNCSVNATKDGKFTWNLVTTPIDKIHYESGTKGTSTLNAIATVNWNGTIFCNFVEENITIRGSAEIVVVDLPSKSEITISPIHYNAPCNGSRTPPVNLTCCIERSGNYIVKIGDAPGNILNAEKKCYYAPYAPQNCVKETLTKTCNFTNALNATVQSSSMTLSFFTEQIACNDSLLGVGPEGGQKTVLCKDENINTAGTITYNCTNGKWRRSPDGYNCVSDQISKRLQEIQDIVKDPNSQKQIHEYLQNLTATVTAERENISSSTGNIQILLDILTLASNNLKVVTQTDMTNVLQTLDIAVSNPETWKGLNSSQQIKDGSQLLQITDTFAKGLTFVSSIAINTTTIMLKGLKISSVTDPYSNNFIFSNGANLSGAVQIPPGIIAVNNTVVTVAYDTLIKILPGDDERKLNGLVMSTVLGENQFTRPFSISMTFQNSNTSLENASCVFWNFTLPTNKAGWDSSGCYPTGQDGNVTSCTCDHLTSFSILMSSNNSFTKEQQIILDYITYIGVGISIASLTLCILIEALVWTSVTKNKTSYMRHVCIVNIAVSLLVADIWFIIGSSMSNFLIKAQETSTTTTAGDPCVAATFFTHYFYLSLFFWMLTMGLVLFYRLVFVFHDLSRNILLGISFFLGYGCPLIIAIITVAVTQPSKNYREGLSCWLNMTPTLAFLAFVVPALLILAVNLVILIVVITKLKRPAVGDKPRQEERSILKKIAKSIAILTPLLGLTWGFGIGTVASRNIGIHGTFAALNSLQGLFILLFGTLWDTKVREALLSQFWLSKWASQLTKSSNLSSSRVPTPRTGTRAPKTPKLSKPLYNIFGQKRGYNITSAFKSNSSSDPSNSYSTLA